MRSRNGYLSLMRLICFLTTPRPRCANGWSRLCESSGPRGVGVSFCSQFPDDGPNKILGQLGNRLQRALRAYTPRDMKAVRTAAETFVPSPKINVAEAISQLGVGEALVSTLRKRVCRCRWSAPLFARHAAGWERSCRRSARRSSHAALFGSRYDSDAGRGSSSRGLKPKGHRTVTSQRAVGAGGTG